MDSVGFGTLRAEISRCCQPRDLRNEPVCTHASGCKGLTRPTGGAGQRRRGRQWTAAVADAGGGGQQRWQTRPLVV